MKTVHVKIDLNNAASLPKGRVDKRRLDKTTEQDIARQQAADEAQALQDAAQFAKKVRVRFAGQSTGVGTACFELEHMD